MGESRSYFLRDDGVGMGGCGNLKETSVKVNLKESGEAGVLDVMGGRGEERKESSVGNTRESLSSATETVACLRLALISRFELPSRLPIEE